MGASSSSCLARGRETVAPLIVGSALTGAVLAMAPSREQRRLLVAWYLDTLFGGFEGFLAVPCKRDPFWVWKNDRWDYSGGGWANGMYCEWPRQRDKAIRDIERRSRDCEQYVCTSLLRGRRRGKDDTLPGRYLTGEIDAWGDERAAVLEPFLAPGSFLVRSGREGHFHYYIRCPDDLTVAEHRALSLELGSRVSDGKGEANAVLRPPGTNNHKRAARRMRGKMTVDPAEPELAVPVVLVA